MYSLPRELVIVGDAGAADTWALLDAAFAGYCLHQVVAWGVAGGGGSGILVLEGRDRIGGWATAYVCVDSVCKGQLPSRRRFVRICTRARMCGWTRLLG